MTSVEDMIRETLVFTAQKGWARSAGAFFPALVTFLGEKLGVEYALVDELLPGGKRARTVGLYAAGKVVPDLEYDLKGTPCENVMGKTLCFYQRDIQGLFPEDVLLQEMGAQSYLGIPLWDSRGLPIGLIAVMGQRPLEHREVAEAVLQLVAVRCAHELERKRSEEEQRLMQAELLRYQKLESVGRLAGGVAHDMNNVLAAIMGVASVLREDLASDGEVAANLDLILEAADRGRSLVKGLTTFSREGLQDARPLDLNRLVREEAELMRRTTFGRVAIELDLQEPLPQLAGEAATLSNALMNLCVNAVDAMPAGGRLTFRSRAAAGGLELWVEDTGEGMTPEVLARAMDPFFTTKPVGHGTGLGLSIVYGAVKAHGGTVELQSRVGEGTKVLLRFPHREAPGIEAPEPQAPQPSARGLSLSVLLVDDDPLVRCSMAALLRHFGHRVELAESGQRALDRLAAGLAVDVAILDQNMPGLSGLDTLRRLRSSHPGLPAILATGRVEPALAAAQEQDGRVWVLQKPATGRELQATLQAACWPPGAAGSGAT